MNLKAPHSKLIPVILFLAASAFAAEPAVHRDLPYTEPKNVRQTLDVYSPAGAVSRPIVFWIHGGGWVRGSKEELAAKPEAFVQRGCVFVGINYRYFPDASIRDIMSDVASALRWTHRNARQFGGDPNSFFVMGHSAGAQLAALVCTDERYLQAEGLNLNIIKGCVPVDGNTYDVVTGVEMQEAFQLKTAHRLKFGDMASRRDLSAVTHVASGKGIPPFLLLHVADIIGNLGAVQAHLLAATLAWKGKVPVKVVAVPGKNHNSLDADIGLPGDQAIQEIMELIDQQMKLTH